MTPPQLHDNSMVDEIPELEMLRKVYCPPLDDATFYAIALDHDLRTDVSSLTAILDDLSAAAVIQENSNFDPSGTGGSSSTNVPHSSESQTTRKDTSISNEITSATTGLIDLHLEDLGCVEKSLQDLPVEGQRKWLKNLFPSLREEHISNVLSDSISLEQAVDTLLNFAFLEASGSADESSGRPVPKGIDGFAEEVRPQQRKGRTKRQHRTNDSSRASSAGSFASDTLGSSNVWSSAAEDVKFICSRTNLQPHTVRSVYHTQGARLPPTIRALAEKEGAAWAKLEKVESMVRMQVAEVKIDYDFVPDAHVYGLLVLARNIPSAARELLEAMTASSESASTEKIVAQYAAPDLTPRNQLPETTNLESWSTVSNGNTRQYATVHGAAASQAFSQASAAYRKSKSDRLMGGAAAYYASVGHENLKVAKSLQAAAANSHVAAQSSSTVLDLHGVGVADATRIAGDRTRSWWDGLGDAKYASGGGGPSRSGFKIVTGIGSHSKNHAPRIGPAVTKMLVREGWKVEVGHGELVVTGKSRR